MNQELNVTRALVWRYIIALSLVASLSTAAWFSLHLVISEQKSTAAVVNVSGRQRMLSQRTALFSNLLVTSPKTDRAAIRGKLRAAIDLMALSHRALTQGDKTLGIPSTLSPTVRAMYFDGPDALDTQVKTYIGKVEELLLQSDDRLTPDNPLLQFINSAAPNSLVTALDRMVHQYQLEGEASINRLQKAETAFWLLTLLLLLLEAALIFHPFVRHIRKVIDRLQTVANELELHQNNLEKMVTQRTSELAYSEEQLRLVLEGAELGFWDWNIITGNVERNEQWAKMLGYSHQEIKHTAQQWTDFIHPDDREMAWQSINDVIEGRSSRHKLEYRMLHKDGSFRWILDQANVMQRDADGKPTRMSGTHSDITERKQLELELKRQAHIDYLTEASSRGHFMMQAELELSRAIRYGSSLSLLMLDIDFFKRINDTHGHNTGDAVLKKLVTVCRETLREVDIIGRMGGEEFSILLPETGKKEAAEAAERLREALASTIVSLENGQPLHFTVSVGVVTMSSKDNDMYTLLGLADKALYEAKNTGRNKVCVAHQ